MQDGPSDDAEIRTQLAMITKQALIDLLLQQQETINLLRDTARHNYRVDSKAIELTDAWRAYWMKRAEKSIASTWAKERANSKADRPTEQPMSRHVCRRSAGTCFIVSATHACGKLGTPSGPMPTPEAASDPPDVASE